MTINRTGLGARRSRTMRSVFTTDPFSRDRTDGGGGDNGMDVDDDEDDDGPDDDESDDEDDDGPDDDESDDKPKKKTDDKLGEPGVRALQKERDKNKDLRRQLRELRERNDGGDADEKVKSARAEEAATWKPLLVKQAARAQLSAAGLIGKPDRLLKLLDLDDIDVDPKTGDIDGLEEQIEDFRREYRELFRKRGSGRIDATDRDSRRDGDGDRKKTATERQAASLLGR